MKRALFLDRDGTIIEDRGYMRDPRLVALMPGAAEALRELQANGWSLVVITNQSGVGRGLITPDEMDAVQAQFMQVMRAAGVAIAATYFCSHRPDENCHCRKPSPFLAEVAAREHSLDLRESWMIGDRRSDILFGKNAGCRTIWLSSPMFLVEDGLADYTARDWSEARAIIER